MRELLIIALVLACPLMMLWMMRGHGHGHSGHGHGGHAEGRGGGCGHSHGDTSSGRKAAAELRRERDELDRQIEERESTETTVGGGRQRTTTATPNLWCYTRWGYTAARGRHRVTPTGSQPMNEVRLDLEGMTCASCAARIERKLNKLNGVEATVNFATEQATLRCDPSLTVDELVRAVESVGYHAHPSAAAHEAHDHDEPVAVLRRRLVAAIVLTMPVALLAMVPPLRFPDW